MEGGVGGGGGRKEGREREREGGRCLAELSFHRLQAMKDDKLMKDGDWMSMREAMRENLPPRFTNEDLQARLEKVSVAVHGHQLASWELMSRHMSCTMSM